MAASPNVLSIEPPQMNSQIMTVPSGLTNKNSSKPMMLGLKVGLGLIVIGFIVWLIWYGAKHYQNQSKSSTKATEKETAADRARRALQIHGSIPVGGYLNVTQPTGDGVTISAGVDQGNWLPPQGRSAFSGSGPMNANTYTMSTQGIGVQATQNGPLLPNSYSFQSQGPKYGATVGTIQDGLQAINSPVANWTGSFVPVSSAASSSSCGWQIS